MLSAANHIVAPILRVVFPHHCEICHTPADDWLCPDCLDSFREQCGQPMCDICGYPLVNPGDPCPRCLHRRGRLLGRVLRLSLHEGIARDLVHHFKYARHWSLSKPLAKALWNRPEIADLLSSADILVPIPLHIWRYYHRGFNQADLLARELARGRMPHLHVIRVLKRTRQTAVQSTLHSLTARARNVKDAFAPRPVSNIAAKRIILIDDVTTTTSTLRAAARALRPLKPASVDALVLTMADPR